MLKEATINSIIKAKTDRSPIWYGVVLCRIKDGKNWIEYKADKIVMKGTKPQIITQKSVKKRAIYQYLGGNRDAKKKADTFNLNNIKIKNIEIRQSLGYGIKI